MAAFGSNYNNANGNNKKDNSPTTYSNVRLSNSESVADPTALTFSYWKGLLRLEITPMKKNADDSYSYDRDNSTSIFFSPIRASLFFEYLRAFRNDPVRYDNHGINTKSAIIYITRGIEEFGAENEGIYLIVKTVNEKAEVTSAIAYQFKNGNNDYYGIANFVSADSFSKNYDFAATLELDMLIRVFDNYLNAIGGAYAATVVDATRFTFNSLNGKLNAIHDNLGIEYNPGSNYKKRQSNVSKFLNEHGNDGYSLPDNVKSSKVEEYDDYGSLADDI